MTLYLNPRWLAMSNGDSSILLLGKDRGLFYVAEGDSAVGMFRQRWFYLREGTTSILRLAKWVYLREDDYWILRLPFGHCLLSQGGKLAFARCAS